MPRLKKHVSSSLNVRTSTEKIMLTIFFVIYCLYALTLIFPVVWTGYNSFKSQSQFRLDSFGLPKEWKLDNYKMIFDPKVIGDTSLLTAVWNTIWRTVGSVTVGIFFSACTSYVVCKYSNQFRWLNGIYTFVVTIMIIPILGSTAAAYEINHNILGIANNPWLWWVTWTSGIGFGFLMQYSAWKSLSWSYAEAAFIDGASNFRVFFQVMMPMIKPIMVSLFVVNFIGGWGEYMETMLYMEDYPSLGYIVYSLREKVSRSGMPAYFSLIMVSMIPTVTLFMTFQETIMQNMTTGGLKG